MLTPVSHDSKGGPQGPPFVRLLNEERAITMVELLTVIVVLGLLMAIAIPAFFNQRDRARDSQAQASARAAQSAAIEIGQENNGRYSGPNGVNVGNLVEVDASLEAAQLSVPLALPRTYTVRVQSDTGNTFDITQNYDGTVDLTCASADAGACPDDGTWD